MPYILQFIAHSLLFFSYLRTQIFTLFIVFYQQFYCQAVAVIYVSAVVCSYFNDCQYIPKDI